MNQAKFEATVVNFKTTGKKTIVQLELTNSAAARNYMFLVGALDKDVQVQLGDQQASIEDFGVKADRPGLIFSAGPSGVVEQVSKEEGEQEFINLTDETEETETEQETNESEAENDESEQDPELENDQGDKNQEPDPVEEDADRIEGKDELETFILNGKAPVYEDIPYDFPELLKRKVKGETWMEIATSLKITSTALSAAWSKYRKQVKAYMEGEEHGAA